MRAQVLDVLRRIERISSLVPGVVTDLSSTWSALKSDDEFDFHAMQEAACAVCCEAKFIADDFVAIEEAMGESRQSSDLSAHSSPLAMLLAKASRSTGRRVRSRNLSPMFPSATASVMSVTGDILAAMRGVFFGQEVHDEREYNGHFRPRYWSQLERTLAGETDCDVIHSWGQRASEAVVHPISIPGSRGTGFVTWFEARGDIEAIFIDAGDELHDALQILERSGIPAWHPSTAHDGNAKESLSSPVSTRALEDAKQIAKQLKEQNRSRPQIRATLRANHLALLKKAAGIRADDAGYPSNATLSEWLKD